MLVYAITKGAYSDYHIVTIVTDKAKAEEIAKLVSDDYEEADVETYDTEQFVTTGLRFKVIEYENGEWEAFADGTGIYAERTENAYVGGGYYTIFARNNEQAIKIAQDMKAKELAEKNGIC